MGTGFLFAEMKRVLELESGDSYTTVWNTQTTELYTLKIANFVACELYLNLKKLNKPSTDASALGLPLSSYF